MKIQLVSGLLAAIFAGLANAQGVSPGKHCGPTAAFGTQRARRVGECDADAGSRNNEQRERFEHNGTGAGAVCRQRIKPCAV